MRSIRRMSTFATPHEIIMDNARVAAIARRQGVFDRLVDSTRLAHAVTGLFDDNHPTHWLLFGCVTGMSDPAENGLILTALSRGSFTRSEAVNHFRQRLAETQPGGDFRDLS